MKNVKPKRIKKRVILFHWSCLKTEHNHKDYGVAQRCIDRTGSQKKRGPRLSHEELFKRNVFVARSIIGGLSPEAAGKDVGIGATRVIQVVRYIIRKSVWRMEVDVPGDMYDMRSVIEHKIFWLDRIQKMVDHHTLNEC